MTPANANRRISMDGVATLYLNYIEKSGFFPKRYIGDSLNFNHLEWSTRGLARANRNKLIPTPYTPPVLCVESKKAEAVIAAVGIRLLGLVRNEFQRASCRRRVPQ